MLVIFFLVFVIILIVILRNNKKQEEKIVFRSQQAEIAEKERIAKLKIEKEEKIKELAGKSHFVKELPIEKILATAKQFYEDYKNNPRVVQKEQLEGWLKQMTILPSPYVNNHQYEMITKHAKMVLRSGVVFYSSSIELLYKKNPKESYLSSHDLRFDYKTFWENLEYYNIEFPASIASEDRKLVMELIDRLLALEKAENENYARDQENKEIERINVKEKLDKEFDQDGDGYLDLPPNDFGKLIDANQTEISAIDSVYIHQFVKISNFIKIHRDNLQDIFANLDSVEDTNNLYYFREQIIEQKHFHDMLLFHAINMATALLSGNMIAFFEIYEEFDKLGIFNSSWQNNVLSQLHKIDKQFGNLSDQMYNLTLGLQNMEQSIIAGFDNLSYITQNSFENLGKSVENQLMSIDSSIKFNSLLTSVQTYQAYRINKKLN